MNPITPGKGTSTDNDQRSSSRRTPSPFATAVTEVAGGSVLLGFGAFIVVGVWAAATVAVWPAVLLGALTLAIAFAIGDAAPKAERNRKLIVAMGAVTLATVVWGYAAIAAFSFKPIALPGWIATACYCATLAIGVWKQLDSIRRALAVLIAFFMVSVSMSFLTIPGQAEETGEPPGFSVKVEVRDHRTSTANTQVVANCTLFDAWAVARGSVVGVGIEPKVVDDGGNAGPWEFPFGHPFKAVLCTAVGRRAQQDGSSEGETKVVSDAVYFPLPGGTYTVTLWLFDSDRLDAQPAS